MEVFTMEICEICGSTDIVWVEDDELEEDLFVCNKCYKKMFGDPPLSCSNMYN
jgi:ribosome-binding protein aMBF1 (putative translation factor)